MFPSPTFACTGVQCADFAYIISPYLPISASARASPIHQTAKKGDWFDQRYICEQVLPIHRVGEEADWLFIPADLPPASWGKAEMSYSSLERSPFCPVYCTLTNIHTYHPFSTLLISMYILFQSDLLLSLFTIFNELRGHSYRQVNAQNREKKKKNTNFTSFINMSQREYRLEIIKSYMNHGDILTKRRQVSLPSCEIGGASTCL